MAHICERYAQKLDVLFNSRKIQVIIYKAYNVKPPDPCVTINDTRVKCVDKVIYLILTHSEAYVIVDGPDRYQSRIFSITITIMITSID